MRKQVFQPKPPADPKKDESCRPKFNTPGPAAFIRLGHLEQLIFGFGLKAQENFNGKIIFNYLKLKIFIQRLKSGQKAFI